MAIVCKSVRVEYHGVDSEDCFPGAGVCNTPFTHIAVGIGDSPSEALEDAQNQIADSDGWSSRTIEECERLVDEDPIAKELNADRSTPHEIDAQYEDENSEHELHCYVILRAECEDVPMIVHLDNEGDDWRMWATVLVTTDKANAEDDQYIDGSSWEIPGDMEEAYTLLVDRPSLVDDLQKAGYTLGLSAYTTPEMHDVMRWEAVFHAEEDGASWAELQALVKRMD